MRELTASETLRSFSAGLFALAVLLGLAWWARDDFRAWIRSSAPAQAATIKCPLPSEHETLFLFVNADAGGKLRVECGMVAGAGAYTRGRR